VALEVLGAVRLMQGNRAEHQAVVQKLAELGVALSARRSLQNRTAQNTTLVAPAHTGMQAALVGARSGFAMVEQARNDCRIPLHQPSRLK